VMGKEYLPFDDTKARRTFFVSRTLNTVIHAQTGTPVTVSFIKQRNTRPESETSAV